MGSTPSPERQARGVSLAVLAGPAVVLAIALFAGHRALAYGLWGPNGPGSGLLPLICSCLLVPLALIDLVQRVAQARSATIAAAPAAPVALMLEPLMLQAETSPSMPPAGDRVGNAPDAISWHAVLMYVAALIGCALLLDALGFAGSAFLSVLFVIHWAERRPWIESLVISAAAVFFVWLLFAVLLSVNLPTGRWLQLL